MTWLTICPEPRCIRCSPHYPFVAVGVDEGVSIDDDVGVDDGVGVDDDAGVDDGVGVDDVGVDDGVGVDDDAGVDDGVGVDDDAGVDVKVGTSVGIEGSAGAGVVLAGFPKPGSVFWPFTVIVVAREIPTAIPRMLIMMTMTTRPA